MRMHHDQKPDLEDCQPHVFGESIASGNLLFRKNLRGF